MMVMPKEMNTGPQDLEDFCDRGLSNIRLVDRVRRRGFVSKKDVYLPRILFQRFDVFFRVMPATFTPQLPVFDLEELRRVVPTKDRYADSCYHMDETIRQECLLAIFVRFL